MYIYKITNLKTKEFYIGKREAWEGRPSLDKYMGSGKIIDIWKGQGASLVKTILIELDDSELLSKVEGVFINHYYDDPLCKNAAKGSKHIIRNSNKVYFNQFKKQDSSKIEWYTTREASMILDVSTSRVRQLVCSFRDDEDLVRKEKNGNQVSSLLIENHIKTKSKTILNTQRLQDAIEKYHNTSDCVLK